MGKRKRATTSERLRPALDFAEQIRQRLDARPPKRARRVLTTWTQGEYDRLAEVAADHGLPIATMVHDIVLSGLKVLNDHKG